jgi:hypothetical protein
MGDKRLRANQHTLTCRRAFEVAEIQFGRRGDVETCLKLTATGSYQLAGRVVRSEGIGKNSRRNSQCIFDSAAS